MKLLQNVNRKLGKQIQQFIKYFYFGEIDFYIIILYYR